MAKYRLGDIAPIQQGIPPIEYPCWLLNLDMVESNTGRILEYVYVQPDEISSSTVPFDANNVLYSKLRPYLNKVVLPDRAGFATSEMLPLRPDTAIITREYLTYFLRSPHFVGYINDKTSGAKMPRANTSDLKAVEIECPSLERQKAIVGIFEHLTTIIDLYQHQLLALDTLIKARFVEMFGDPDLGRTKPDWVPISSIGTVVGGATPKTNIAEYWDGEYRWLTPAELDTASWYIYDSVRKLTEAGVRSCSLTEMPAGTVILSSRAPIGKVAIAGNTFYCNQGFKNIICNNEVNPIFLYSLLVMNNDYLNSLGRGATFKEISKAIVENIRIPVPPYAKQKAFAEFCIQVDKSKVVVQKALNEARILFNSLMQKYFQ